MNTATITRKITTTYRNASHVANESGNSWYDDVYTLCEYLAWRHNYPIENVVCAFSHLSPRVQFVMNVKGIHALVRGEAKPNGLMARSWNLAQNALNASDPWATFGKQAHKTKAFAQAINGDTNACVVDVWAARVAGCETLDFSSAKNYTMVSNAYVRAAKILQVNVRELQAITWCALRGRAA